VNGWEDAAACRGQDPELWFDPATFRQAKAICHDCPVRMLCLAEAYARREPLGVWGGLTPEERGRRTRRRRRQRRSA
jgi:hypothetical protein